MHTLQHPGVLFIFFTVLLLIGAIVALTGEPESDRRENGSGLVLTALSGYVLTVISVTSSSSTRAAERR